MSGNSFQKNPFIKSSVSSSFKNTQFTNYDKLGRKTVEEVKQDMVDVKFNNFLEKQERKTEVIPAKQPKNVPNFKNRINNLKNINRG